MCLAFFESRLSDLGQASTGAHKGPARRVRTDGMVTSFQKMLSALGRRFTGPLGNGTQNLAVVRASQDVWSDFFRGFGIFLDWPLYLVH
jgi:hypothetical protein